MGVILAISAVILMTVCWIILTPGHLEDPEEDQEQEEYLKEWRKKHGQKPGSNRDSNRVLEKSTKRKGGKK